ncbi:MAG: RecQ family ATP-dependent DNA helicase [Deltaproteobacteria bacterium]|nr:RecQ family ATP-dependent DNA helicase [Deltaproteobacteria bacterium]
MPPPVVATRTATLDLAALTTRDLTSALERHFGHAAFRPGQEAIVRSVLSARPTLAILPTGGGKSLCYQLPALLLPGTTIVISPLVALMKDQVEKLRERGIAATFINSSLPDQEQRARQMAVRRGEVKLLYVAPERFRSPSFISALEGVQVPLLAVDEAHCISAWGHDFRPDYARLAQARKDLRAERVLALTATATPEVRKDIARGLALEEPRVFVAGFDRPNLFLEIVRTEGDRDKLGRLLALCRSGQCGVVYAGTRKNVEKTVLALRGHGINAVGYHAGLADEQRSRVQDQFLQGEAKVIVATNAFGMGVDKPDIRFVAHYDVPRSVEAYYQEVGRAGRDGKDSLALLLFNFADVMMQRRLIDLGRVSEGTVLAVMKAARRLEQGTFEALARAVGMTSQDLQPAVRLLESTGHFARSWGRGSEGNDFELTHKGRTAAALDIDFEQLALRVSRERQMLDRMVRFADTTSCRRQNLLRYFGDVDHSSLCRACDNCQGPRAPAPEHVSSLDQAQRKKTRRDLLGRMADALLERGQRAPPADDGPYDEQAFTELKAWRTQKAREQGVPPYVVAPDSALRGLARELPESESTFLLVKGAGPARWERYGEDILRITRAAAVRKETEKRTGKPVVGGTQELSLPEATEPPSPREPLARQVPGAVARPPTRASEPLPRTFTPSSRPLSPGPSSLAQPPLRAPRPESIDREMPYLLAREPQPSLAHLSEPAWLDSPPPEAPPSWADSAAQPALRTSALRDLVARELTLADPAAPLGQEPSEVASQLAAQHLSGAQVDREGLFGAQRLAQIREAAQGTQGNLVAVRKRLPFELSLAEIRLALL